MMAIKNFLQKLFLTILTGFVLLSLTPAHVAAQGRLDVCEGITGTRSCPDERDTIERVVEGALNLLSIVVGIAAVIMIMIGGFRYITSGGDASKVSSAQQTIIWAVVGLVVAAMAQVIVQFVLARI